MTFDEISEFILTAPDIPESSIDMASTLLIDTLGIGAGATTMDAGKIARNHAVRFHGAPNASDAAPILFDGRMASIPGAAFAAATQIDNLDGHDGYNPTKGHIGCAVVPALAAFAHHTSDLKARDALKALVMSYEVSARAAITLHNTVEDYHTSGAWNAIGVAALGCHLRRSSTEQLRQAMGIAEYHGPRSQMMREIANPTMLHDGSGMGAFVGAMATLMAEEGFEGAPAITVESEGAEPYWADLGSYWTVEQNYIKPHPICRWAHAAIDALGELVLEHGFSSADVAKIRVKTFAEASELYRGIPMSSSQAQYSLPFALAIRMVHGHIGPDNIQGEGLKDAVVAEMVDRIEVEADDRHSSRFPKSRWSDVTVKLTDGTVLESGDVHAKGGPESPMTMDEIRAKFFNMTTTLSPERQDAIWAMRDKLLHPDTKFSQLLSLITPAAERAHG